MFSSVRKTIISVAFAGALACGMNFPVSASAPEYDDLPEPCWEMETQFPNSKLVINDTMDTAESIPMGQIAKGQFSYMIGHFIDGEIENDDGTTETHIDRSDWYSFTLYPTDGHDGRLAIRLAAVSSGDDYELNLYDKNGTLLDSTKRNDPVIKLVKTPKISTATKYYIEVKANHISDGSLLDYHVAAVEYISTVKKTLYLSPSKLTSTSDVWSSNASKSISLPDGATVVSAKISSTKGSTNKNYGNQVRVKINNGSYTTVTWTSGKIDLPQLVGQPASGTWYVGFKAKALSGSTVSMSGFKIELEYEYDTRR